MPPDAALERRARARRAALQRRLLAWYARHARDLPWRANRDPWGVWVSEVMLQQTQVVTATPHYRRFLRRFPTVAHLARATPARVLAAWAGLGYYRRARHLHAAARTVVREHGGAVPADERAFGALPGVGRYTRGAVLSMAFDHSLPVLDGNVARVLSRLFALDASVRTPAGRNRLWRLAELLVPMRGAGEWNQALMELGALTCIPRSPRCGECPVRGLCRAHGSGRVDEFPPAGPARAPRRVRRAVAVVWHGRWLLMVRREGTLLGGLWEPPGVELADSAGKPEARRALVRELKRLDVAAQLEPTGERVRHLLTHRTFDVDVWRGRPERAPRVAVTGRGAVRWVDPARRPPPMTGLARRVAALAAPHSPAVETAAPRRVARARRDR